MDANTCTVLLVAIGCATWLISKWLDQRGSK